MRLMSRSIFFACSMRALFSSSRASCKARQAHLKGTELLAALSGCKSLCKKNRKGKFTIFSDHNRSLLRQQPRAALHEGAELLATLSGCKSLCTMLVTASTASTDKQQHQSHRGSKADTMLVLHGHHPSAWVQGQHNNNEINNNINDNELSACLPA